MASAANFTDLAFHTHRGGQQGIASFDNGYSVSVVQFPGSFGYKAGLWELAVIHDGEIVYDTPVTDDVLGYLTEDDVSRHMAAVAALPPRTEQVPA